MSSDSSWQVLLADLSLILFLSTAAALAAEQDQGAAPILIDATPVAQHRLREGGPTLGEWLATQPDDARLRLTLVIPFEPWFNVRALRKAEQLAREARDYDKIARVIIEPSRETSEAIAILSYEGERKEMGKNPNSGIGLAE